MKAKTVSYKKVFNLGNYQNEQIGIEVELDPTDDVAEIIRQCKNYVIMQSEETTKKIQKAEEVLNNPDNYTGLQVKMAQRFVDDLEKNIKSLPTRITDLSNSTEVSKQKFNFDDNIGNNEEDRPF